MSFMLSSSIVRPTRDKMVIMYGRNDPSSSVLRRNVGRLRSVLFVASGLAALCIPAVLPAQQTMTTDMDRQEVLACVQSAERAIALSRSYGRRSYDAEDRCILAPTNRCTEKNKSTDLPLAAVKGACASAELDIWQQLLKESYDSEVNQTSKLDADHKDPGPALPQLKAAQEAWEQWAESECQFDLAATKLGSDRPAVYPLCMVVLTARRVFYYRTWSR